MQLPVTWATLWLMMAGTMMGSAKPDAVRCVAYLTGQHDVVPSSADLVGSITHVILAFMRSEVFNIEKAQPEFPLFTTVDKVRSQFQPGTKIIVAIGGWGDSAGFEEAARDEISRKRWASQVRVMVDMTGADGVDIDWEYPGGNRDDYKQIPNHKREWEIEAFVLLLQELRSALGSSKLLSVAVPALERDLMAFTPSTVPQIVDLVDFISIMTYDMMNRRDKMVTHHSGVAASQKAIERYMDRGAPPQKLNLGLGYYVKWFMTQTCDPKHLLGCPTQLLEDPITGADLGKTAAFSWHDKVPAGLAASFSRARTEGKYSHDGSYGYWDPEEKRWWSYDTPDVIKVKLPRLVGELNLGGVFAWGLGEDAPQFANLRATIDGVRALDRQKGSDDEARDEL